MSKEKVARTLDGEFGGEHDDLTICNLQQRIRIVVDEEEAAKVSENNQ